MPKRPEGVAKGLTQVSVIEGLFHFMNSSKGTSRRGTKRSTPAGKNTYLFYELLRYTTRASYTNHIKLCILSLFKEQHKLFKNRINKKKFSRKWLAVGRLPSCQGDLKRSTCTGPEITIIKWYKQIEKYRKQMIE